MNSTLSVWLLTNLPSPYQLELLDGVATQEVDLRARFMRPADTPATEKLLQKIPHQVMGSFIPAAVRDEFRLHPQALREAAFGRFDCFVLSGLYTSITFICCAFLLTLRRKPWCMWLERPRPQGHRRWGSGFSYLPGAGLIRRILLKTLFWCSGRVICMGTAAVRDYEAMGMPKHKLLSLPYCIDVDRYADIAPKRREQMRQNLGVETEILFLYSGQMIPRKGVDTLIEAFTDVAQTAPNAKLMLLGDGEQKQTYEQLVPDHMTDRVQFLGHQPQENLPEIFAACDVFVFPSRHDGWAVVINEACASNLPVITTRNTGAAHDLVTDGESGFIIAADDPATLAEKMTWFLANPESIRPFGVKSKSLVDQFGLANAAARFRQHVESTIGVN